MTTHRLPARFTLAVGVLAVLVATCGADPEPATTTTTTPATTLATTTTSAPTTTAAPEPAPVPAGYEGYRTQPAACGAATPSAISSLTYAAPDDMGLDPAATVMATITTSCGDIVVELDPSIAPATVNSFVFLATQGYFDGTVSHRVVPGFVIQAGDPTGTGRGNPGYAIPDEFPPGDFSYGRGVLAMANAGPGSTGSQFFIVMADTGLQPVFSVFGTVVSGFDVIDTIAGLPLGVSSQGEQSVPLETVYLEKVTVEGFGG